MGVCVIENLSRVFLSEWLFILLWVMRVYIVWVKGKKVTLKNPPSKEFRRYLARRPYSQNTRKILQASMTLQLSTRASYVPFSREPFSRANHETALILYFMLNSSPT